MKLVLDGFELLEASDLRHLVKEVEVNEVFELLLCWVKLVIVGLLPVLRKQKGRVPRNVQLRCEERGSYHVRDIEADPVGPILVLAGQLS